MHGAISKAELDSAASLLVHVPYSLHCNFAELHSFVSALRPRAIEGIVPSKPGTGQPDAMSRDPHMHFAALLRPPQQEEVSHG